MIPSADLLCDAIELASKAHYLTEDKQGEPYILHPLRVMLQFHDLEAQIVAVLHDVVEDSGIPLSAIAEMGFPATVIDALDAISKRPDEPLEDYWTRVKGNELARAVKIQDIYDNVNRLHTLMKQDQKTAIRLSKKYRQALLHIGVSMPDPNRWDSKGT